MIELGKKQTLFIVKSVEFGVYLAEDMHAYEASGTFAGKAGSGRQKGWR